MGRSDESHHSSASQMPGVWYLDLTETHQISKSKRGLETAVLSFLLITGSQ